MKTSLDIPDDLYRQLKAKSALEGKSVREVATSLFTAWVADLVPASVLKAPTSSKAPSESPDPISERELWLAEWRSMAHEVAAAMDDQPGLVSDLLADRR